MVRQLLDVVHHAIELPLPIHLRPAPQGEAGEPFVVAQVAEHRLHRRKAGRDHVLAGGRFDLRFHPVGMALLARALALEEGDLPGWATHARTSKKGVLSTMAACDFFRRKASKSPSRCRSKTSSLSEQRNMVL